MIINHNLSALNAYNKLNSAAKLKSNAMEKVSSGMRINEAADDAAGSSISEKMKAQIRGLEQASRNVQDGISLTQTAEAGLGSIENPDLQRMRNLIVQSLNGTLKQSDRMIIQNELENIKGNINDIANNTEFNTIKLLAPPSVQNNPAMVSPKSPKLDIVFMVDNSGSMTGNINTVKNGIEDFVNNLQGIDTKIAIVNLCFGSPYDVKNFESDPSKISDNLNKVKAVDGTRPYDIIQQSVPGGAIGNELSYRQDSKKIFVVFTDTNDEKDTSITEQNAKDSVEGKNIVNGFDDDDIQTYFFGMGGAFPDNAYNDIVNSVGGKIYHPMSSQDISDNLKDNLTKDIKESIKPDESNTTIIEDKMPTLELQVGANSGQEFQVELFDARTKHLGIDDVKVDPIEEAEKSLEKVDKAIDLVSSQRAKFGTYQNALEHIEKNVDNYGGNISSAESRITDADMAKEIMEVTKSSIIEQSAQSILKQAQKMPESIINLMDKWQAGKSTT